MGASPDSGVVIIGAGLAGLRCATTLRSLGYSAPITMIGEESSAPYERPALSKELLAGTRTPEQLALVTAEQLADQNITFMSGQRAVQIDPDHQRAVLENGEELTWSHLVFATGSRARDLPQLRDSQNVGTLRTDTDAQLLQDALQNQHALAVLGCGFVGAEVASTFRAAGCSTTIIEPAAAPFERTLGTEVGQMLHAAYSDHGIDVMCGESMTEPLVDATGNRITGLVTSSGVTVQCDTLLVSIGAIPNDELFHQTFGTAPGGGIAVDEFGQTAYPNIYACGDVASAALAGREDEPLLGAGTRVEHWTDAAASAANVARTIAGAPQLPRMAPYVWSDQLGLRLQLVGSTHHAAAKVIEPELESLLVEYYDARGRCVGYLGVNRARQIAQWRKDLIHTQLSKAS